MVPLSVQALPTALAATSNAAAVTSRLPSAWWAMIGAAITAAHRAGMVAISIQFG